MPTVVKAPAGVRIVGERDQSDFDLFTGRTLRSAAWGVGSPPRR